MMQQNAVFPRSKLSHIKVEYVDPRGHCRDCFLQPTVFHCGFHSPGISLATCRYSDTGPQFAVCVSEWGLAEAILLMVMHLHSDGQSHSKQPSAMCTCTLYQIQTSFFHQAEEPDRLISCNWIAVQRQTKTHQCLLGGVEQTTGCTAPFC